METKELKISEELLDHMSIDELVDLKVETEELLNKIDNLIEECNKMTDEVID